MMTTLYFHGAPGSAAELTLFRDEASCDFITVNRQGKPAIAGLENRFTYWASKADELAKQGSLRLAGFSMGGYIALNVAARMTVNEVPIDLIAPPAPFQAGEYVDRINGKPIFKLGQSSPALLRALVTAQSLACRIAPSLVARQIFANSAGADVALAEDKEFMRNVAENLRQGMGYGAPQFYEEILGGVTDWRPVLAEVKNPVRIWHGTVDNWSLPEMSDYLETVLANCTMHHRLEGLSHYSALQYYLHQAG